MLKTKQKRHCQGLDKVGRHERLSANPHNVVLNEFSFQYGSFVFEQDLASHSFH